MDKVDLALVLAVDGSASVGLAEFGLIAGGLAAAIRDPEIVHGLTRGGPSLVAVLLWSGRDAQEMLLDWTPMATQSDADTVAQQIEDSPRLVRAGLTAIGAALAASAKLLLRAPAQAARQVVDVAGDGRSNDGVSPAPVRDRLAEAGVTINGLCVLHEESDLLDTYRRDVIGGPGAFATSCPDYAAFADAMRRKLLRELLA